MSDHEQSEPQQSEHQPRDRWPGGPKPGELPPGDSPQDGPRARDPQRGERRPSGQEPDAAGPAGRLKPGEPVPVLGTAAFQRDDAAAEAVLSTYLERGGRTLDTARIYGDSERTLGLMLSRLGEAPGLRVISKGAHPDPQDWLPRLARDEVLRDLNTSVELLGRPIDLYLLHRDDEATAIEEIADTLLTAVEDGLALAAGASNWSLPRLRALDAALRVRSLRLAAVSNYFGLATPSAEPTWRQQLSLDAATLAWLEEQDVPNVAWSSQSSGYFARVYRGHQFDGPENERRRGLLDEVARAAGAEPAAVLARWSATASPAIVPVISSSSPARLSALMTSMRDRSLDPAVAALRTAVDPAGRLGAALIEPAPVW